MDERSGFAASRITLFIYKINPILSNTAKKKRRVHLEGIGA